MHQDKQLRLLPYFVVRSTYFGCLLPRVKEACNLFSISLEPPKSNVDISGWGLWEVSQFTRYVFWRKVKRTFTGSIYSGITRGGRPRTPFKWSGSIFKPRQCVSTVGWYKQVKLWRKQNPSRRPERNLVARLHITGSGDKCTERGIFCADFLFSPCTALAHWWQWNADWHQGHIADSGFTWQPNGSSLPPTRRWPKKCWHQCSNRIPNEHAMVFRETLIMVSFGPNNHIWMVQTEKETLLHVWRSTTRSWRECHWGRAKR